MWAATAATAAAVPGTLALAQGPGQGAQRALFNTKAEAEAAARQFNCKGAHRMGNQWMPCASHAGASGQKAKPSPQHSTPVMP
ncbi:uncharacterized conserved secreted protein (DUF3721) [Cyanobium sp. NS01]|nr:uncharacterized conserved secreted protein (DUF3721) [Cyanobium sp. NS01]